MKKNKLLIFLAAAAPILLVALCYRHLPDTVPTSWRLDGEVVYSRKSALWLISGSAPFWPFSFFCFRELTRAPATTGAFPVTMIPLCCCWSSFCWSWWASLCQRPSLPGKSRCPTRSRFWWACSLCFSATSA